MKYSKFERMKCPHGRIYWGRWEWDETTGQTIEDSHPDFSRNGCKLCNGD